MKKITYEDTIKRIDELQKYIELEGTELGEAWNLLCSIHNRHDYLSDKFTIAIRKEIKEQLDYLKKHTTIVKEERTQTYTVSDIVWNDE